MEEEYVLDLSSLGLDSPVVFSDIWESYSPIIEGQEDANMEDRTDAPRSPDIDNDFMGDMADYKYNVHFTANVNIDNISSLCAIREALLQIPTWSITRVLFRKYNCSQMTAEQLSMRLELLPIVDPGTGVNQEFSASFGGSLPPAKDKSSPMKQKVLTSAHIIGANVFTGGNERGIPLVRLRDGEEIRATVFITKGSAGISYKGNRYGDCRFSPLSLVRFRKHSEDDDKVIVSFTKVGNLNTKDIFDSLVAEFGDNDFDNFDNFDADLGAEDYDDPFA